MEAFQMNLIGLVDFFGFLMGAPEIRDILKAVTEKLSAAFGVDRTTIYIYDEDTKTLNSIIAQNAPSPITFSETEGIAGHVARHGDYHISNDPYSDKIFNRDIDQLFGYRSRSILTVPIHDSKRRLLGVLQLINRLKGSFSDEDAQLLSAVSRAVAVKMEEAMMNALIREQNRCITLLNGIEKNLNENSSPRSAVSKSLDTVVSSMNCSWGNAFFHHPFGDVSIVSGLQKSDLSEFICTEAPFHDGQGNRGKLSLFKPLEYPPFTLLEIETIKTVADRITSFLKKLAAESERDRSSKLSMLGKVTADLIHDMKAPLTIIKGYSQILENVGTDGINTLETAKILRHQADMMETMCSQIMEFSRGDHGEPSLEKLELKGFFLKLHETFSPVFQKRGSTLELKLENELFWELDRNRIERALTNLLMNACDALAKNQKAYLWAEIDSDRVLCMGVTDNGPGIPVHQISEIFKPFVSFGKKTGTGLGLSLARFTAQAHGGDLILKQQNGQTSFIIRIPWKKTDEKAENQ
jgi:signal transduction histidine kinase